jgi:hypothetical protein
MRYYRCAQEKWSVASRQESPDNRESIEIEIEIHEQSFTNYRAIIQSGSCLSEPRSRAEEPKHQNETCDLWREGESVLNEKSCSLTARCSLDGKSIHFLNRQLTPVASAARKHFDLRSRIGIKRDDLTIKMVIVQILPHNSVVRLSLKVRYFPSIVIEPDTSLLWIRTDIAKQIMSVIILVHGPCDFGSTLTNASEFCLYSKSENASFELTVNLAELRAQTIISIQGIDRKPDQRGLSFGFRIEVAISHSKGS